MKRALLPIGIFVVLVVFLAIGLTKDPRRIPSPLIGKPAPEFMLPVLGEGGRSVALADFREQVVLVNVWGSWCGGCRTEHQTLMAMAATREAPIIGLNWKDDEGAATAWLKQLGDPYVVNLVDADGRAAIDFGVYGAPETFVIDKKGIVVHKHIGPVDWKAWKDEILPAVLLAKESS